MGNIQFFLGEIFFSEFLDDVGSLESLNVKKLTLYGVSFLLQQILPEIISMVQESLTMDIDSQMVQDLIKKLQIVPLSEIQANPNGFYGAMYGINTNQIIKHIFSSLRAMVSLFVLVLEVVKSRDWILLGTVLSQLLVEFRIDRFYSEGVGKKHYANVAQSRNYLRRLLGNILQRQESARLNRMESIQKKEYESSKLEAVKEVNDYNKNIRLKMTSISACVKTINFLLLVATGYWGNKQKASNHVFFRVSKMNRVRRETTSFLTSLDSVRKKIPNLEKFFKMLELPSTEEASVFFDKVETLSFKEISVTFPGGKNLFQSVSFEAKSGNKIALLADNGVGKTTLWKLLFCLHTFDVGEICINGKNIQEINSKNLRSLLGIIPQDIDIFPEKSLLYNLCLRDHFDDPQRIKEVVQKVGLGSLWKEKKTHDKIGSNLSDGEKKRIGLARVLLQSPQPSIYIFDELTSGLDIRGQYAISNYLTQIFGDRPDAIFIIITHNLLMLKKLEFDKYLYLTPDGIDYLGGREDKKAVIHELKELAKTAESKVLESAPSEKQHQISTELEKNGAKLPEGPAELGKNTESQCDSQTTNQCYTVSKNPFQFFNRGHRERFMSAGLVLGICSVLVELLLRFLNKKHQNTLGRDFTIF